MGHITLNANSLNLTFSDVNGALIGMEAPATGWVIHRREALGLSWRLLIPVNDELRNNPVYGEKQALRGIPGSLPDLTDPPKGCVFAPRCPYATERCRQERPQVREYEPGHFAACHRCQEREAE